MPTLKQNVCNTIVIKGWCSGCGVCAGVCPSNNLKMQFNSNGEFNPVKNKECTNNCSVCLLVCPFGNNSNEDIIGSDLFANNIEIKHHPNTGYYLNSYAGYVADENWRLRSASGGMGTWFLNELLRTKIVDEVFAVTPTNDPEKLFEVKSCKNLDEIIASSKSCYYPVEFSQVIKQILSTNKKYALIGLPCVIKAVRLAMKKFPSLNNRIIVTAGLVCGQLKNKFFTEYLTRYAGIKEKNILISFRIKNNSRNAIDYDYKVNLLNKQNTPVYSTRMPSKVWSTHCFKVNGCNYCDDVFSECADVVFMDAWLTEYEKDWRGTSLVITRDNICDEIFIKNNQRLELSNIPIEKVSSSQERVGVVIEKTKYLAVRLKLLSIFGKETPVKRVKGKIYLKYLLNIWIKLTIQNKSNYAMKKQINSNKPFELSIYNKNLSFLLLLWNLNNFSINLIFKLLKLFKNLTRGL
jgi:coenzyme F420 hydrogenase subunit beta